MFGKTAIVACACLLMAVMGVMTTASRAQQIPPIPPGPPPGRYQLSTHVYKEANGVESVVLLLVDTNTGQVWHKQESTIDQASSDKWLKLIEPVTK